ncbi:MAG: hypothetical protein M3Q97_04765, partial [Bacteroidota bacterium]|nr:hypothetical protein [Bacteroidota bacterium]
ATLALSIAACRYAGHGEAAYIVLAVLFILCCLPALLFIRNKTPRLGSMIEHASGIWTIGMYLTLGGAPMLHKLLTS